MRTKDPNNKGRKNVLRAYRNHPNASLLELAKASGLSRTTVYYHMNILESEGVLTRNHQVGKPAGTISKNRYNSQATRLKKAEAGRRGKGSDALHPKKSKKDIGLHERIDLVVKMAKEKEQRGNAMNSRDVLTHSPVRMSGAMKVG